MPVVQSLRTHLVTELRDLLDAEHQLTKVLGDFAKRATTPALRAAFEQHLTETEGQIRRLEDAFASLGESSQRKRCEGIQGLIREGNGVVGSTPEGVLRDAVMITSAQKVEHYEMASYGTARTYATVLGEPKLAALLDDTLQEEKNADAKLTAIAEERVNEKAAEEWHQLAGVVIEQAVSAAGRAIGVGARTVKRAAEAIRQRSPSRSDEADAIGPGSSSRHGSIERADSANQVPRSAPSPARRLGQRSRRTANRKAARTPARRSTSRKTKKRAQK
jgi:ferritin-like metal-binding protein YciE